MKISDFTFKRRLIQAPFFEVILTNKDGMSFGLIYSAKQQMPDEVVFAEFQKNPKVFFIEAEVISAEIIEIEHASHPQKESDGK
jgi:hypothetical protein